MGMRHITTARVSPTDRGFNEPRSPQAGPSTRSGTVLAPCHTIPYSTLPDRLGCMGSWIVLGE